MCDIFSFFEFKVRTRSFFIKDSRKKHNKELKHCLCTKNVHFSFDNDIYIQIDGVAMGSHLGPVIANIFMVERQTSLVPKLEDHLQKWRRFVDDTFAYVKVGSVEYVLSVLNSFHKNIKFNYEEE